MLCLIAEVGSPYVMLFLPCMSVVPGCVAGGQADDVSVTCPGATSALPASGLSAGCGNATWPSNLGAYGAMAATTAASLRLETNATVTE